MEDQGWTAVNKAKDSLQLWTQVDATCAYATGFYSHKETWTWRLQQLLTASPWINSNVKNNFDAHCSLKNRQYSRSRRWIPSNRLYRRLMKLCKCRCLQIPVGRWHHYSCQRLQSTLSCWEQHQCFFCYAVTKLDKKRWSRVSTSMQIHLPRNVKHQQQNANQLDHPSTMANGVWLQLPKHHDYRRGWSPPNFVSGKAPVSPCRSHYLSITQINKPYRETAETSSFVFSAQPVRSYCPLNGILIQQYSWTRTYLETKELPEVGALRGRTTKPHLYLVQIARN